MDKDLQDAPLALNVDNEKIIRDELRKSRDKRAEINTNARIEQLERENQMLKEQVEQGGLADTTQMLQMAEEKNQVLQGEIELLQEQVRQFEDAKETIEKQREDGEQTVQNTLA